MECTQVDGGIFFIKEKCKVISDALNLIEIKKSKNVVINNNNFITTINDVMNAMANTPQSLNYSYLLNFPLRLFKVWRKHSLHVKGSVYIGSPHFVHFFFQFAKIIIFSR